MKQLVIEKKFDMWNNIVEKANQEFEGNKKPFWSFVGRRTNSPFTLQLGPGETAPVRIRSRRFVLDRFRRPVYTTLCISSQIILCGLILRALIWVWPRGLKFPTVVVFSVVPRGRPTLLCSLLILRRSTATGMLARAARARERIKVKRRTLLLLAMSSVLTLFSHLFIRNARSVWMHSRSSHWWEDVVLGNFGECDWIENFRMSRETFHYLCNQLRPLIQKQNTRMRRSLSTERRVAITLWVLATPGEYRSVAHLFRLARCTVCQIVNETCRAIVNKLLRVYIRFPTRDSLNDVVRGFKEKFGIPQCVGSIDGSHIPVTPPAMNHTVYYNRKGWYSMLVQAVVDHN